MALTIIDNVNLDESGEQSFVDAIKRVERAAMTRLARADRDNVYIFANKDETMVLIGTTEEVVEAFGDVEALAANYIPIRSYTSIQSATGCVN